MDRTSAERLRQYLEQEFGEHLRAVAFGDPDDHEFLFVRDEVRETYSPADQAEIRQDVMFETLDSPRQESLYSLGTYVCTVRVFEQGVLVTFTDKTCPRGVLVSLDVAADPPLVSFMQACRKRLEG